MWQLSIKAEMAEVLLHERNISIFSHAIASADQALTILAIYRLSIGYIGSLLD